MCAILLHIEESPDAIEQMRVLGYAGASLRGDRPIE